MSYICKSFFAVIKQNLLSAICKPSFVSQKLIASLLSCHKSKLQAFFHITKVNCKPSCVSQKVNCKPSFVSQKLIASLLSYLFERINFSSNFFFSYQFKNTSSVKIKCKRTLADCNIKGFDTTAGLEMSLKVPSFMSN